MVIVNEAFSRLVMTKISPSVMAPHALDLTLPKKRTHPCGRDPEDEVPAKRIRDRLVPPPLIPIPVDTPLDLRHSEKKSSPEPGLPDPATTPPVTPTTPTATSYKKHILKRYLSKFVPLPISSS